jgi:hypothetical protein
VILLALLVVTFSTYALILLVALAFAIRPKTTLAVVVVATIGIHALASSGISEDGSVRAVIAISRLLSVDFDALLPSISLIDPSLGYRFITLAAGVATTFYAPLGYGLGCDSLANAFNTLGWDFTFSDAVLAPELRDGCLKPSSFFSSTLLAYGLLALPVFGALVAAMRPLMSPASKPWWPALIVGLLILTVQCQVTNPIPWMILYMSVWHRLNIAIHNTPMTGSINNFA